MSEPGGGHGSEKARRSLTRGTGALCIVLALAAGTTLTIGAAGSAQAPTTPQTAPALVDLNGSADLRKQFNNDRGHVRLVLLLSPT